jgi:hypothetical protein
MTAAAQVGLSGRELEIFFAIAKNCLHDTARRCDLFVFDDNSLSKLISSKEQKSNPKHSYSLNGRAVRVNRAAIRAAYGYDHDSRHCRSRSPAWRRRLIRPWMLVQTLIPSDHKEGIVT